MRVTLAVPSLTAFLLGGIGTVAPGGATIELFSGSEGAGALVVPSGAGRPGWEVQAGKARYGNPDAPAGPTPVRLVSMQSQRRLKIVARAAGLPLAGPQGRVGVRGTTGTLRQCALFEGASIRVDEAGQFLAAQPLTPSPGFLLDCSDAPLTGLVPACTLGTFSDTDDCPAGFRCVGMPGIPGLSFFCAPF